MTTFELWKYFYLNDLCTKETLQLLVQLKTLTQDEYNQIIAAKPDLTGRIIVPIPKGNANTETTTKQAAAQG